MSTTKTIPSIAPIVYLRQAHNWLSSGLREPETLEARARAAHGLVQRAIDALDREEQKKWET